jgi:tetratricopeptide (TPR) repeat protein
MKQICHLFLVLGLLAFVGGCNNPEGLMQKGNLAYRAGDKQGAANYYKQALNHEQTKAVASFNLGRLSLESGQAKEALAYFEMALSLEVEYPYVRLYHAQALVESGDSEAAYSDLERLTKAHPDFPDGFLELAKLQAANGEFAKAAATVQSARNDLSLQEEATLLAARCHREAGDLPTAVRELETLMATHSYRVSTHFTLAKYLLEAGDYSGAERRFRSGLEMDPTNAEAVLGLGQSLEKQQKSEEAARFYQALIGNGQPEHPLAIEAKRRLDRLQTKRD